MRIDERGSLFFLLRGMGGKIRVLIRRGHYHKKRAVSAGKKKEEAEIRLLEK
jgi:hypothetical protein